MPLPYTERFLSFKFFCLLPLPLLPHMQVFITSICSSWLGRKQCKVKSNTLEGKIIVGQQKHDQENEMNARKIKAIHKNLMTGPTLGFHVILQVVK